MPVTLQVAKYTAPKQESVDAVNEWIQSAGLTAQVSSHSGDWITVDVPVSKANDMLDAKYNVYTEEETGRQLVRTLSYSIPSHLKQHIALIHPTHSYVFSYGCNP